MSENQIMPFFLQSWFWSLLMLFEIFKWVTGWWYEGGAPFNLYLSLYVILRRIEWEVGERKTNLPWFTNNN